MQPKGLSASSIERYEACPAGFKVDYIDKRAPDAPSLPSMNGTACHAALEAYVENYRQTGQLLTLVALLALYESAYWDIMPDKSFLADGREMLTNWYQRQNWEGRTVVCCETKEQFPLAFPNGLVVPVTYIWDRCDSLDGGDTIEVTDYKTVRQYVSHDELRHRVQPALYALAAKMKFPQARHIKFTLDLLRYSPVTTTFTTEELRDFYVYLRRMYARMYADDGSTETINSNCTYCVRRPVCDALKKHVDAGGIMSLTDMNEIADRRREVADQVKALTNLKKDLDDRILTYCQEGDVLGFATPDTTVQITARGSVDIDQERARTILTDAVAFGLGYPSITPAALKKFLDMNPNLDHGTQSALRQLMAKRYGAPYVKTSKKLNKARP